MTTNLYDPTTALDAYFPDRTERRTARVWAKEKLIQDLGAIGVIDVFEGAGTDPTGLDGYDVAKFWLNLEPGLTESPGTLRSYDGSSDPTLLASWPVLSAALFKTYLGARTAALEYLMDGGGSPLNTGIQGDIEIPYTGIITAARLLADQSGSLVVDIWKDVYANFPPTVADSICGAAKPTLSAASKSQDTTLAGWTTAIAAGDILRFKIDSVSTITRVTLSLTIIKT